MTGDNHPGAESPPPSSRVEDSTAATNHQVEEDMTHLPTKEIPHPLSKPCNPWAKQLEFIKVGCHLDMFVVVAVHTEVAGQYLGPIGQLGLVTYMN
jgi:hypothetical protein